MSDPFVGEIRMFGGNFAPSGWMFCNGQLVNIADYQTLFTLIGTTYGGNGSTTFALPDLRGRLPVGEGTGSGLSSRVIAQAYGTETVTLTTQQMPLHTHPAEATTAVGTLAAPAANAVPASTSGTGTSLYSVPGSTPVVMSTMIAGAIGPAGGGTPHDNMMPYLCVSYIISLFGVFPSRN